MKVKHTRAILWEKVILLTLVSIGFISDDCVFAQYLSNMLFKLEDGTGWQDGLRVSQMDVNEYNIGSALQRVVINTSQNMQIIRHAVHFPRSGEKAREIHQVS